jgi:hypothetical protein
MEGIFAIEIDTDPPGVLTAYVPSPSADVVVVSIADCEIVPSN